MPGYVPVLGDIAVTEDGSDFAMVEGAVELGQRLQIGASTFKKSWKYDTNKGVDYLKFLGVKDPEPIAIAYVRRWLLSYDDVVSIKRLDVEIDKADRSMTIDFEVQTSLGFVSDTARVVFGG